MQAATRGSEGARPKRCKQQREAAIMHQPLQADASLRLAELEGETLELLLRLEREVAPEHPVEE